MCGMPERSRRISTRPPTAPVKSCLSAMSRSLPRAVRLGTVAQNEPGRKAMDSRPVSFFSEGVRLAGDLFLPGDLKQDESRSGIVLCHGYTGVRNLYLPDIAKAMTDVGYVLLTIDYKGWGDSEGSRSRLAPYSRV